MYTRDQFQYPRPPFMNLCDLYWFDVFLLSEIISNFISLNYKYRFMSFYFYIGWKSLTWGLPTYIFYWNYKFELLEKSLKLNIFFFAGKSILYKNTQPRVFFCLRFIIWFTDMHQTKCIICDNYWSVSSER